ncbi:MAG: hypothetical protein ACTSUN_06170 [Promethearchaeota archaeon]
MLNVQGWIIGSTALAVLLLCVIFGLFFMVKSKQLNAKLLYYAGFMVIFTGLFYLGSTSEFLSFIIFSQHLDPTYRLQGILAYCWVAPAVLLAMYLGVNLLDLKRKGIILGIYFVLALFFEIYLFAFPRESFDVSLEKPQEELSDVNFVLGSPTFILIIIFLLSALLFNGIGCLIKSKQSTGDLRKKFLCLSLGFIIFVVCGALDSLIAPGISLIFIRAGMVIYSLFIFIGLKPTK